MFAQSVKSHNENIMAQYRENSKLVESQDDSDLASDFNANLDLKYRIFYLRLLRGK